jgi:WD40 repeat protein
MTADGSGKRTCQHWSTELLMNDTKTQVRLRPVIRVFVSSTFSDMKNERNALEAEAFPQLEQLCQSQGFQFQAIDLRWGVSTEAGLDHRTMRICFDELRRAQEISPKPNFLILLGNRYGWRPLPEKISVEEFHTLEHAAAQMPVSTDKSAVAVLHEWYREDTNAVPPVYQLQSRRQDLGDDQDYTRDALWNLVQAVLWAIINRAMPPELLQHRFDGAAPAGSPPAIVRFQASATEQEIWHGALRVPDAREHVLAFFREIENLAAFSHPKLIKDFVDVNPSGSVETALQAEQDRLKAELRDRLGSANVFRNKAPVRLEETQDNQGRRTVDVTTNHLAQLCADVDSRLSEIIQGQIDEYWRSTAQAPMDRATRELEIEQSEYERFAEERGGEKSFVGRKDELRAILDYVKSDSRWPLVIHGASGCGKTALLARASQEVAKTRKRIERFIGVAPRSSDIRSLLSSLCQELRQRNPRADALPTEIKELRDEFIQHLQTATPKQPLILFLDALDQLADADNGRLLNWLPLCMLPNHVKFVVSCLSDLPADDPAGQPWAELQKHQLPAENKISLDAFSKIQAWRLLFKRWLPHIGRTANRDQRRRIWQRLKSKECHQPIYLKLLFEEVQLWHSYDPAPEPGESVYALLGQLFNRLSQPRNHGPLLVNRVLGYLAASRHGLAESEILEILFADPEYRAKLNEATEQTRHELPPNAKRIPIALWSRLRFDLAPYLTERAAPGANVLTFYHRQVTELIQGRFAKSSGQAWQPHKRLAYYFRNLADPEKNQTWQGESPRPFLQLVFHLVGAESAEEYCQTLCDLRFVEARCQFGQVFELIADYHLARRDLPEAQADLREERNREERVRRWMTEIIKYARQWNERRDRLSKGKTVRKRGPKLPDLVPIREMWSEEKTLAETERILIRPVRRDRLEAFINFVSGQSYPLLKFGKGAGFVSQHAYNWAPAGPVRELAARLLKATDVSWIERIWPSGSIWHPKPALLGTLVGHDSPVASVSITPDGRIAVSGSRDKTVRVWDVKTGRCLQTFDGHLYWVDSVSVTADGERVVSGSRDGTVRVWDVERGVCHQMLEGHTEGVRSVRVTPDGGRAVSGGGDMKVRVWDFKKDKYRCRYLLEGHVDTVNSVDVTPDGLRAVSASWDGSIAVWNLGNGTRLHVLRPDECDELPMRAHCVSITPNGRYAVSGHEYGWIYVWDTYNGKCLDLFHGHEKAVWCVSITPDGRYAVSGGDDRSLNVWDLRTDTSKLSDTNNLGSCTQCLGVMSPLRTYHHGSWLECVAVTPDLGCAIVGAGDGTLRSWDLRRTDMPIADAQHSDWVMGVEMARDGERTVSVSHDRTLKVWTKNEVNTLSIGETDSEQIECVSMSPDGKVAVLGDLGYFVHVIDLDMHSHRHSLSGHVDRVTDVCVYCGSRRAISASWDGTLCIWDLERGTNLATIGEYDVDSAFSMTSVSVTPDGRIAVSGDSTGTLTVWDLTTMDSLCNLGFHGDIIRRVRVTEDGRRAVSACYDETTLYVWDLETNAFLFELNGHTASISDIAISPNGQWAVSGSDDKTIRVWDLEKGICLAVYQASETVRAVAISRDWRRMSIGAGNSVEILRGHSMDSRSL